MATAQRFGGGLVEISAVATIIGAPTAESLMHGLKAASGLAWGPMSCFGGVHVTKACLSSSIPDWLREPLGLRNGYVDNALGVLMDIDHKKQSRHRIDLGDPCAVQISTGSGKSTSTLLYSHLRKSIPGNSLSRQRTLVDLEEGERATVLRDMTKIQRKTRGQCMYTFDKNTQLVLGSVSAAQKGEAIRIHYFAPDFEGIVPAWKDWTIILLSAVKIVEVVVLRQLGSNRLWFCTLFGWGHAFVAACVLQACGLGRDSPMYCNRDIAAGILPSALHIGEFGKIVLNNPMNVRRHVLWRGFLGVGIFFNAAMLFSTFIFMSVERSTVIYVWVAFQALWLIARSVIFYFVEGAGATRQGLILSKSWRETSSENRDRAMTLLDEVSKYQVSNHPRGAHAYTNDCISFAYLTILLQETNFKLKTSLPFSPPASPTKDAPANLEIRAVTGDCLIRTAVWASGLQIEANEIYDSCIAFVASGEATSAVSCVRVYTCLCLNNNGRDRGNSNHTCGQLEWVYFIPTSPSPHCDWIFAHSRSSRSGAGLLSAEVRSGQELDRLFSIGYWKISLNSLQELRAALIVSQEAGSNVVDMLRVAAENRPNTAAKGAPDVLEEVVEVVSIPEVL